MKAKFGTAILKAEKDLCKVMNTLTCYVYDKAYERGKSEAEEAYRTRYSVLNLCHKTIATDRVSQDNQIRKQTLEEVLKEIEIEREQRIKNKQVDYGKYISAMEILATFEIRIREMLEHKIKELSKDDK